MDDGNSQYKSGVFCDFTLGARGVSVICGVFKGDALGGDRAKLS